MSSTLFTENPRYYPVEVNGRKLYYPSVTTVLTIINKPQLNKWMREQADAEAIRDEAADIGTALHGALHQINLGGIPDTTDPMILRMADAYLEWEHDMVDEVVAAELTVHSHLYQYAGKLDQVCRLKSGMLAMPDYKSSKAFYPEMGMQLAAYERGYREEYGVTEPIQRMVLRFHKDNPSKRPDVKTYDNSGDDAAFLYALGLYRHLRPMKQEMINEQ